MSTTGEGKGGRGRATGWGVELFYEVDERLKCTHFQSVLSVVVVSHDVIWSTG